MTTKSSRSKRDATAPCSDSQLSRSEQIATKEYDDRAKLDDYMLGISVTLCAFLAKTNTYAPVGINGETLQLCSLIAVAGAAWFGYGRRRAMISFLNVKAHEMEHGESEKSHAPSQLSWIRRVLNPRKDSNFHLQAADRRELYRNLCLTAGLFLYAGARVLDSYGSNGWIQVPSH